MKIISLRTTLLIALLAGPSAQAGNATMASAGWSALPDAPAATLSASTSVATTKAMAEAQLPAGGVLLVGLGLLTLLWPRSQRSVKEGWTSSAPVDFMTRK